MAWIEGVEGSRRGFAQEGLQLGEPLLDRVEIGAVGRQVEQPSAGVLDRRSDALHLVARQIVEDVNWTPFVGPRDVGFKV